MNAERLHAMVKRLKAEMEKKNLMSQMQSLVGALRSVSQQSNAQNQQNLSSYRTSIYQLLSSSEIDQFSPSWRQTLEEIGGQEFFGSNLKTRIETILAENQMTPAVAADQLEAIRQRMEQFSNALTQCVAAFGTFRIGDEKLLPGECEVGMLIPRDAVNNRLTDFTKELQEMTFILNTFSEVATGQPDDLIIKTLSSSSLLVYLQTGWKFAECLAKGVGRVVELYKGLIRLRKTLEELSDQGVPAESAKGIEEYANHHMEKGIDQLSVEIVNDFYGRKDDGRKNELKIQVRLCLNGIANRIDNGYNIEVRCAPLDAADDNEANAEKKAALTAVQEASANMQFLKLEGTPLLSLPGPSENKATTEDHQQGAKPESKRIRKRKASAPRAETPGQP